MTTIALFGATGRTGRRVLEQLLGAGHEVRALVRTPSKLQRSDARLTVILGDVTDPEAVTQTITGATTVLSVFGQVKGSSRTVQTDGTRTIVDAMKKLGVRRLVTLSGGGLRDPHDQPKAADKLIVVLLKLLAGHVLADAQGHLEVLQGSALDWTVVRGPRLTEKPGTGKYRVGWVGVDAGTQVSRDDLASFIVTQVDDRSFVHAMPFVSN